MITKTLYIQYWWATWTQYAHYLSILVMNGQFPLRPVSHLYCFLAHTSIAWPFTCLFICSLLMFSHVQFSTRYFWIRYFVIQSRFLSTTPRISFRQIFHDFLHSHTRSCLSQHHYLIALHQPPAEMLQPGRCHLPTAPKIPVLWLRSLGPLCSPEILTLSGTTHCCRLAVFYWLSISPGRLTVPSSRR